MKTDSGTLCDRSAQGRFHLILSSRFAFLTLPFSLLVPLYLYFFTSGWSSLSSSSGFQFPSVRLCLKYADISDVCILFSLSRTSPPEARSKMLGDGHVTNVRLAVCMRGSLPTLYIATRPHLMFLLSFLSLIYIHKLHPFGRPFFLTLLVQPFAFSLNVRVHFLFPVLREERWKMNNLP
jgi:hypothetical protein